MGSATCSIERVLKRRGMSLPGLVAGLLLIFLPACAAKPNRFIILSDLHPHPDQFDELVILTEHIIRMEPAFLLVLGDMGSDQVPGLSEPEIAAIRPAFDRIRAAGIEIFPVMGNHDVHPRVEAIKTSWLCAQTPQPLNRLLDVRSDSDACRAFTSGGPYCYSLNRAGIHFAVLDSNCTLPGASWEAERAEVQQRRFEAHRAWMQADLCGHANNPQRFPTIVFVHHPEYMTGDRRMDERPLYHVLAGCPDAHTVRAVFGGHWHYGQNFPADQNLGVQVYAAPASVHPPDTRPREFIVAEVKPDRITFIPHDSITGRPRLVDKPVRCEPISGSFGRLR
ncbi:MAG: hypothetical protein GX616_04335 [Planctomycetes bacterium]|nr:hypothetical protein [Planctomycetota bacterium]